MRSSGCIWGKYKEVNSVPVAERSKGKNTHTAGRRGAASSF
jgi:hypothetical protein